MIIQILKRTKELIQQGWCQEDYAQNKDEVQCHFTSPQADRWCLSGAIRRAATEVAGSDGEEVYFKTWNTVLSYINTRSCRTVLIIADWNDRSERTQEEVLVLIDEVIQDQEKANVSSNRPSV